MLSCTGVLVVGVTSVVRERERERERKRGFGLEVSYLSLPLPRLSYSACLCSPSFAHSYVACSYVPSPRVPLRKALDIPFIDARRRPAVQWGCSYELTWLAEKCLEPCTCTNVAVGEVP
jgi:hypothetical protein